MKRRTMMGLVGLVWLAVGGGACGSSAGADVCESIDDATLTVTDPETVANCPSGSHPSLDLDQQDCLDNANSGNGCSGPYNALLVCFRSSPDCYGTDFSDHVQVSGCTAEDAAWRDCVFGN